MLQSKHRNQLVHIAPLKVLDLNIAAVWLALLVVAVVAWLVLLVVQPLVAVTAQGCFLGCLLVALYYGLPHVTV